MPDQGTRSPGSLRRPVQLITADDVDDVTFMTRGGKRIGGEQRWVTLSLRKLAGRWCLHREHDLWTRNPRRVWLGQQPLEQVRSECCLCEMDAAGDTLALEAAGPVPADVPRLHQLAQLHLPEMVAWPRPHQSHLLDSW